MLRSYTTTFIFEKNVEEKGPENFIVFQQKLEKTYFQYQKDFSGDFETQWESIKSS